MADEWDGGSITLRRAPGTCCPEPNCDSVPADKLKADNAECKECGHKCRECYRDMHPRCRGCRTLRRRPEGMPVYCDIIDREDRDPECPLHPKEAD